MADRDYDVVLISPSLLHEYENVMDTPIQIPMIDVPLPKGWVVKHTIREWMALSASGKMKVSITHDGHAYHSRLIRTADKVGVLEVQAPDLLYVIPAIERFVSLVTLSELPDNVSPPPDTDKC